MPLAVHLAASTPKASPFSLVQVRADQIT
ncbi:hypothetical protein PHET_11224 [Paragonimus heterotremus]|uniref:Uncharacterized protein n=1 Tax=Paragonimus heterotremus TaxID=100268 RepID=A0A8J4WDL1_9TREM|nr:hypothetical protein PHET_11224 [Paragonimus heterotremus]